MTKIGDTLVLAESIRVWDGRTWVKVQEGLAEVAVAMDRVAVELKKVGDTFRRAAMAPHLVEQRPCDESWVCVRCGAIAWDLDVIREIDCS